MVMLPEDYRKEAVRLMELARETDDEVRRTAYQELAKSYQARAQMTEALLRKHGV
jgi:oligoendopeptidase F